MPASVSTFQAPEASERTLVRDRPPVRAVLAAIPGVIVFFAMAIVLAGVAPLPGNGSVIAAGGLGGVLLVCVLVVLVRLLSLSFELTTRRTAVSGGVLARWRVELLHSAVGVISIRRTLVQRVLGLGTVLVQARGSESADVVIVHVRGAEHLMRRVREAVDQAMAEPHNVRIMTDSAQSPPRLPVIGLAGGIGAGKSTVARAFAALGAIVIDSDQRAKAALDRPDVRERLVEWWGREILTQNDPPLVDRAKVASIIFSTPAERARLEGLVHPIVRQDRARMIEEASASGATAVIVDAPLLFEAAVDKECDVVVFVDAPREQRLARVISSRGWDEAELTRREASQMSLDHKRARCQYRIDNSDARSESDVREQARLILGWIRERMQGDQRVNR